MCRAPGALKRLPEGGARAGTLQGKKRALAVCSPALQVEEEETDGASDVIL